MAVLVDLLGKSKKVHTARSITYIFSSLFTDVPPYIQETEHDLGWLLCLCCSCEYHGQQSVAKLDGQVVIILQIVLGVHVYHSVRF